MPDPITTQAKQNPPPLARKPQKITQLLCLDQNLQLKSIFIQWLSQSFKYLPNLLGKIYLQLQLIINFIQYRFTVSMDRSQVGDYLQNIKYKKLSKKIKLMYLMLDVIGPYLKRRVMIAVEGLIEDWEQKEYSQSQSSHKLSPLKHKLLPILKTLTSLTSLFDKLYALGSFINLAVFIKNGRYRTLVQRILGMQMEFVNPQNSRVLNFTLMNRTMIWEIYEMVLKNVLPYLHKFLGTGLKNIFYLHSYMGVEDKEDHQNCAVCGETPTMTIKAEPCQHLYCFYCSKGVDDEKRFCKKCGETIQNWQPIYG